MSPELARTVSLLSRQAVIYLAGGPSCHGSDMQLAYGHLFDNYLENVRDVVDVLAAGVVA